MWTVCLGPFKDSGASTTPQEWANEAVLPWTGWPWPCQHWKAYRLHQTSSSEASWSSQLLQSKWSLAGLEENQWGMDSSTSIQEKHTLVANSSIVTNPSIVTNSNAQGWRPSQVRVSGPFYQGLTNMFNSSLGQRKESLKEKKKIAFSFPRKHPLVFLYFLDMSVHGPCLL